MILDNIQRGLFQPMSPMAGVPVQPIGAPPLLQAQPQSAAQPQGQGQNPFASIMGGGKGGAPGGGGGGPDIGTILKLLAMFGGG